MNRPTTLEPVLSPNAIKVYAALLNLARDFRHGSETQIIRMTGLTKQEVDDCLADLVRQRLVTFGYWPLARLDVVKHERPPETQ